MIIFIWILFICQIYTFPKTFTYLQHLNSTFVKAVGNTPPTYDVLYFSHWTCKDNAKNIAYQWTTEVEEKERKQIRQRFKTFDKFIFLVVFGPEQPSSQGLEAIDCANLLSDFLDEYPFDGVNIDFEDSYALAEGPGIKWLIDFTRRLKEVHPELIVSHSPIAPYFNQHFYKNAYVQIQNEIGDYIDYYNIKFYNQKATTYDSYKTLFQHSNGWAKNTSVSEINLKGIPLNKIVIGKPAHQDDVKTGFVQAADLGKWAYEFCKKTQQSIKGFMITQFASDPKSRFINEVIKQYSKCAYAQQFKQILKKIEEKNNQTKARPAYQEYDEEDQLEKQPGVVKTQQSDALEEDELEKYPGVVPTQQSVPQESNDKENKQIQGNPQRPKEGSKKRGSKRQPLSSQEIPSPKRIKPQDEEDQLEKQPGVVKTQQSDALEEDELEKYPGVVPTQQSVPQESNDKENKQIQGNPQRPKEGSKKRGSKRQPLSSQEIPSPKRIKPQDEEDQLEKQPGVVKTQQSDALEEDELEKYPGVVPTQQSVPQESNDKENKQIQGNPQRPKEGSKKRGSKRQPLSSQEIPSPKRIKPQDEEDQLEKQPGVVKTQQSDAQEEDELEKYPGVVPTQQSVPQESNDKENKQIQGNPQRPKEGSKKRGSKRQPLSSQEIPSPKRIDPQDEEDQLEKQPGVVKTQQSDAQEEDELEKYPGVVPTQQSVPQESNDKENKQIQGNPQRPKEGSKKRGSKRQPISSQEIPSPKRIDPQDEEDQLEKQPGVVTTQQSDAQEEDELQKYPGVVPTQQSVPQESNDKENKQIQGNPQRPKEGSKKRGSKRQPLSSQEIPSPKRIKPQDEEDQLEKQPGVVTTQKSDAQEEDELEKYPGVVPTQQSVPQESNDKENKQIQGNPQRPKEGSKKRGSKRQPLSSQEIPSPKRIKPQDEEDQLEKQPGVVTTQQSDAQEEDELEKYPGVVPTQQSVPQESNDKENKQIQGNPQRPKEGSKKRGSKRQPLSSQEIPSPKRIDPQDEEDQLEKKPGVVTTQQSDAQEEDELEKYPGVVPTQQSVPQESNDKENKQIQGNPQRPKIKPPQ